MGRAVQNIIKIDPQDKIADTRISTAWNNEIKFDFNKTRRDFQI